MWKEYTEISEHELNQNSTTILSCVFVCMRRAVASESGISFQIREREKRWKKGSGEHEIQHEIHVAVVAAAAAAAAMYRTRFSNWHCEKTRTWMYDVYIVWPSRQSWILALWDTVLYDVWVVHFDYIVKMCSVLRIHKIQCDSHNRTSNTIGFRKERLMKNMIQKKCAINESCRKCSEAKVFFVLFSRMVNWIYR